MEYALACAVIVSALFVAPAYPEDGAPAIGQGTSSCATWKSAEVSTQVIFHEWMLGFLSGAKWVRIQNGRLNGTDLNAVWAWIDSYCTDHPLEQISAAASTFLSTRSQVSVAGPPPNKLDELLSEGAPKMIEIPAHTSSYVDIPSIHRQKFKPYTGIIGGDPVYTTLTVAWITVTDQNDTAKAEVIFDCKGRFAVIQQVIVNETADSRYHSFDQTRSFDVYGVTLSSIVPDSVWDGAQTLICRITK